jgi:hypothetical protein
LWSVGLAAAALGIAQAAIDELLRLAATRTPFGMDSTLSTRTITQIAVCEATATSVRRAGSCGPRQRMRRRPRPAPSIVMYTAAGGTAVFASSPLQRCLRDVHTVTQHVFVALPTYEMLGKTLLGVEPDGFML